jgi:hypothetical protein
MCARRALPIAVAVVLSAMAASPARADSHDDAEADAAIKRGVELRRHAKDQDALEEFRKAYALVKSPRALAQVGLAEQALGRWADAENDLAEAMASKSDPWIRKNLSTLSGAVDVIRNHLGSLDVIGPAGAELLINGHSAGTLPLAKPVRLPIGSLTIEVRKEGFFPVTRPVSVAAGELTRESVDLQPVPAKPPAIVQGGGIEPPPPPLPPPPPPDDHAGGSWQRTLAWIAGGGAVVGIGVGVVELLIKQSKDSDLKSNNCTINSSTGTASSDMCASLATSRDSARIAAIVGFSAGGALAIASALLFVTSSPSSSHASSSSPARTALVCAPSLLAGGATATCQLRF